MNVLDTFFDNINWNRYSGATLSSQFFGDSSSSTRLKHSYAMQVMEDCLNFEPGYTKCDILNEETFLKELQQNEKSNNCYQTVKDVERKVKLRPGELVSLINYPKVSTFTLQDITKYYNWSQILKFKGSIPLSEVSEMDSFNERLRNEQQEFLQFARKDWHMQNYLRHTQIIPSVKQYIDRVWQVRLETLKEYPPFYKQIAMIPLVYHTGADKEGNTINMVPGKVLLKQGKPAKFERVPNNVQTFLTTDYGNLMSECPPQKKSNYPNVSSDPIAEHLIATADAQVVISSSGLKCLLDNHCLNLNAEWDLPVVVKEYTCSKEKDKQVRRVVYINKKLPPKSMTMSQRVYWHSKIALRLRCCVHEDDVSYTSVRAKPSTDKCKEDSIQDDTEITDDLPSAQNNDSGDSCASSDSEESEVLVMDISDEDEPLNKVKEKKNVPRKTRVNSSALKKPVTATKTRTNATNTTVSDNAMVVDDQPMDLNSFMQQNSSNCYVYQMWHLGKENQNQLMKTDGMVIPIMIRSRHDCVEFTKSKSLFKHLQKGRYDQALVPLMRPIHVVPKLEYQYDYGAERVTNSESIRHWADSVIRPNSYITRARINPLTCEVIQCECLDQHRLKAEVLGKNGININNAWSSLYSVLSKLITLPPGNYLLKHLPKHGSFIALFSTTEKQGIGVVNLYSQYNVSVTEVAPIQAPWVPLDETLKTPMVRYRKTLPLIFPLNKKSRPTRPIVVIGKRSPIKAKKKKKTKRSKYRKKKKTVQRT